jgi:hypothetical protein
MRIAEIRQNALRSLIPPPRLALSQWIESNIRARPAKLTGWPSTVTQP